MVVSRMPDMEPQKLEGSVRRDMPFRTPHGFLPEKDMANYNEQGEITRDPNQFKSNPVSVVNTALSVAQQLPVEDKGVTSDVAMKHNGLNADINQFAKESSTDIHEQQETAQTLYSNARVRTEAAKFNAQKPNQKVREIAAYGEKNPKSNKDTEKRVLSVSEKIGAKIDPNLWDEFCKYQLKQMTDLHCWISEYAWTSIHKKFEAWGPGSNFVGTISAADKLLNSLKTVTAENNTLRAERRINILEQKLSVPKGAWAMNGKDKSMNIYRFKIMDPSQMHVSLPKGNEAGVDYSQWIAGGKTLGGLQESVMRCFLLDDFKKAVANGSIKVTLVDMSKENIVETPVSEHPA